MARVQELFSELFSYVLLFDQNALQGEFQPPYEQVYGDIAGLIERQKAAESIRGHLKGTTTSRVLP